MMKKNHILALSLALVTAISLAGCSGGIRNVNVDLDVFNSRAQADSSGGGDASSASPASSKATSSKRSVSSEHASSKSPVGSEAASSGGGSLQQALADGSAVQYDRAVLNDSTLNCEAVRSFMPAGWQAGGQVLWNLQSLGSLATIDFYIVSPDNTQRTGYISQVIYADPNSSEGAVSGGWDDFLHMPALQYVKPEEYAAQFMSGYVGTQVQVQKVTYPEGEDQQAVQAYQEKEQQAANQSAAENNQQNSGTTVSIKVDVTAAYTDMTFSFSGMSCKSRVSCMLEHWTQTYNSAAGRTVRSFWSVPMFSYDMGEQSGYDDTHAAAELFMKNMIVNEQWSGAMLAARQAVGQQMMQQWMQQQAQIRQATQRAAQAYSSSNAQDYSSSIQARSQVNSDVLAGWGNAITGKSYYESADGGAVLLDDSYYHTYNDGNGGFIQSNEPLSGYDEATDLGTMGGD